MVTMSNSLKIQWEVGDRMRERESVDEHEYWSSVTWLNDSDEEKM